MAARGIRVVLVHSLPFLYCVDAASRSCHTIVKRLTAIVKKTGQDHTLNTSSGTPVARDPALRTRRRESSRAPTRFAPQQRKHPYASLRRPAAEPLLAP